MGRHDDGKGARRHGRLPTAERAARRAQILDAAMDEITARGYEQATMAGIARRAGASKETLYAWFDDKAGLVKALIETSAFRFPDVPDPSVVTEGHTIDEAREILIACASGLLALVVGREFVALSRAAVTSPELADVLLATGRSRIGSVVEAYLARLHDVGVIHAPDSRESFGLFYGIVVKDVQIRTLLGGVSPGPETRRVQAERAVDGFLVLTGLPSKAERSKSG